MLQVTHENFIEQQNNSFPLFNSLGSYLKENNMFLILSFQLLSYGADEAEVVSLQNNRTAH